jgi:Tol biopolymer transport system component
MTTGTQDIGVAVASGGGAIAFTRIAEQNRLWLSAIDGTAANSTPVTDTEFDALFPDLAPNDNHVAFVAFRSGLEDQELMRLSIREQRTDSLRHDEFRRIALRWSPNSRALAYRRSLFSPGRVDGSHSLVILDLDTNEEHILTNTPKALYDIPYDWFPDGERLLVGSNRTGRTVLYSYRIADGDSIVERAVTLASAEAKDIWGARVSPNGRWLTFSATSTDRPGESIVYVTDLSGGNWHPVTEELHWSDKARWGRDGCDLYMLSNRATGVQNVWRVSFDPVAGLPTGTWSEITHFRSSAVGISSLIASVELGIGTNALVLPVREASGAIWALTRSE